MFLQILMVINMQYGNMQVTTSILFIMFLDTFGAFRWGWGDVWFKTCLPTVLSFSLFHPVDVMKVGFFSSLM